MSAKFAKAEWQRLCRQPAGTVLDMQDTAMLAAWLGGELERRLLAGKAYAVVDWHTTKGPVPRRYKTVLVVEKGRVIPLSARKLSGRQITQRQKVIMAMRAAIHGQIVEFRKSIKPPVYCHVTGELLGANAEVDHVWPPFIDLAEAFAASQGLPLDKLPVAGRMPNYKLKEPAMEQAWQDYHRKNAVLAMISSTANKVKGRKCYNINL